VVLGVPEIVGAWAVVPDTAVTTIEKVVSEAVLVPSLTLIAMFASVPAFPLAGVPESVPVDVLKLAQEGMFAIEKTSVLPVLLVAVGVKE